MTSTRVSQDPSVRLCDQCHQERQIQDFRFRSSAGRLRYRECRQCHNQAERIRRARERGKLSRTDMAKVLSRIRNESHDARVVAICEQMATRFGGINGIIRAWEDCLARDMEKGGHSAFRHLAAIVRLAEFCQQSRAAPGAMAEDELEAAIARLSGDS